MCVCVVVLLMIYVFGERPRGVHRDESIEFSETHAARRDFSTCATVENITAIRSDNIQIVQQIEIAYCEHRSGTVAVRVVCE